MVSDNKANPTKQSISLLASCGNVQESYSKKNGYWSENHNKIFHESRICPHQSDVEWSHFVCGVSWG